MYVGKYLAAGGIEKQRAFFAKLRVGDVFTYSTAFSYNDISILAFRQGVIIQYCPPKSTYYQKHGAYTCEVLMIDASELDLLKLNLEMTMEHKKQAYNQAYEMHDLPTALRERHQLNELEIVLLKIEETKARIKEIFESSIKTTTKTNTVPIMPENFRKRHPEQVCGEFFMGNAHPDESWLSSWKSLRFGDVAYDTEGRIIPSLCPAFVSWEEYYTVHQTTGYDVFEGKMKE